MKKIGKGLFDMTLRSIHTGFLTGNIFYTTDGVDVTASAVKYSTLLHNALREAYPGVTITIDWQDAEGIMPSTLRTQLGWDIDLEDDMFDSGLEDATSEDVDLIADRVWQEDDWIVKTK